MPVTTGDIRDAFRLRTTRAINELRRQLMEMDAAPRVAVILEFGVEEFIRQWAEIVEVRRRRGGLQNHRAGRRAP